MKKLLQLFIHEELKNMSTRGTTGTKTSVGPDSYGNKSDDEQTSGSEIKTKISNWLDGKTVPDVIDFDTFAASSEKKLDNFWDGFAQEVDDTVKYDDNNRKRMTTRQKMNMQ